MVTGQTGSSCDTSVVIAGVNGFTWTGGSIGPIAACISSPCSGGDNTNKITSCTNNAACNNITFDGVVFHDVFAFDSDDHQEAFKIDQGQNVFFRHNQFIRCINCNSATVFFGASGSKDTADFVTFEDNFVGPAQGGGNGITYGYNYPTGTSKHLTFRYNTIDGTLGVDPIHEQNNSLPGANLLFEGNVAYKGSYLACAPGATYTKNTWYADTPGQCGTDNPGKTSTSGFYVSPGSPEYDYHLAAGSPLISAGGTGCAGLTDIDGQARPIGTCDVGADEFSTGTSGSPAPPPPAQPAPPSNLTGIVH